MEDILVRITGGIFRRRMDRTTTKGGMRRRGGKRLRARARKEIYNTRRGPVAGQATSITGRVGRLATWEIDGPMAVDDGRSR